MALVPGVRHRSSAPPHRIPQCHKLRDDRITRCLAGHEAVLLRTSFLELTDEVPQTNNRLIATVVFKPEHAHTGGPTEEYSSCGRGQPVPTAGDHPNDVAAGERENVATHVT